MWSGIAAFRVIGAFFCDMGVTMYNCLQEEVVESDEILKDFW